MNYPLSAAQTSKTHYEGHQVEWVLRAFPIAAISVLPSATGRGLSWSLSQRARRGASAGQPVRTPLLLSHCCSSALSYMGDGICH